jgi:hypothetical protein
MVNDPREEQLNRLFQAYRRSFDDPEPSAAFTPGLWAKIEQRRSVPVWFRRMAQGFVTAAVALSLALFMLAAGQDGRDNPDQYQPYVETLAAHHVLTGEDVEPVAHVEAGVEIDLL